MIQHDKMEYDGSQENVGFIDFIRWYNFDYIQPYKHGEYLTSDAKTGDTTTLYWSTPEQPISSIIFPIIDDDDRPIWSNNEELTNDEIIDICNETCVWYTFETIESYGEYLGGRVVIISDEDTPKYWTDINKIVGPTEEDEQRSPIHIEYDNYYGIGIDRFIKDHNVNLNEIKPGD